MFQVRPVSPSVTLILHNAGFRNSLAPHRNRDEPIQTKHFLPLTHLRRRFGAHPPIIQGLDLAVWEWGYGGTSVQLSGLPVVFYLNKTFKSGIINTPAQPWKDTFSVTI
jgi:hypothetical protein